MIELFQYLKPFSSPLFRSISPSPCPFGLPPGVPNHYKPFTPALFDSQDGVGMASDQTINFWKLENHFSFATDIEFVEEAAKKTIFGCL